MRYINKKPSTSLYHVCDIKLPDSISNTNLHRWFNKEGNIDAGDEIGDCIVIKRHGHKDWLAVWERYTDSKGIQKEDWGIYDHRKLDEYNKVGRFFHKKTK